MKAVFKTCKAVDKLTRAAYWHYLFCINDTSVNMIIISGTTWFSDNFYCKLFQAMFITKVEQSFRPSEQALISPT